MPRVRQQITREIMVRCRELVFAAAAKYDLPPVYITAHIRIPKADIARREVWSVMIDEMGLKRQTVATIFGRDRRRIRASVLARVSPVKVAKVRRVRKPAPFQPVGNQFVWNFALPIVLERTVRLETFMRPVPASALEKLEAEEKKRLIQFHEREARMLRKSVGPL